MALRRAESTASILAWAEKATARRRAKSYGGVKSFAPPGRSQFCLYVVSLKEHPGVSKVGKTTNWSRRREQYAKWNLRHEAIAAERVFVVTDEFFDLDRAERAVLARMPFEIRHGAEWFEAEIDDAARHVAQFLDCHDVSYELSARDF